MNTERKEHINRGDILVSSWGYDQTNATFYEAQNDARPGAFVRLMALRNHEEPRGDMTGRASPILGSSHGDTIRRKVQVSPHCGATVRIESYEWARLWDGRAVDVSHYA